MKVQAMVKTTILKCRSKTQAIVFWGEVHTWIIRLAGGNVDNLLHALL